MFLLLNFKKMYLVELIETLDLKSKFQINKKK